MRRAVAAASASSLALASRAAARARSIDWPTERPPRPLPRARGQLPALPGPDAAERAAGDRGLASRAAGGQPAPDRARRRRAGSGQQAGRRVSRGVAARSGHHDEERRADRDDDRLDRRRDRRRRGERPDLHQRRRHEGQPGRRPRSRVRPRAASGVRDRGDRAAAAADPLGAEGQLRRSRLPGRRRVRSARLRVPSVRQAGFRHAGIDRRDHARGSARVPQALVRRQQRHPRDRRRRHGGRSVRGRRARVRQRGSASICRRRRPTSRRRRPAASSSSIGRARRRPRSASATSALPRRHHDYLALDIAIEDPRRRRGQPAASRASLGARPDLRRVGGSERAQGHRRHRRRDRHAIGEDRRSAAADGRGDRAAAAPARAAARAGGRAGIPDRQLSADDRNAERDRAAGAERGLLRPRPERAADLPRARQRDHGRRHPARRAAVPASRRLSIVLVGDASVFAKELAGVGFDQVERIPIARPRSVVAGSAPACGAAPAAAGSSRSRFASTQPATPARPAQPATCAACAI